MGARASKTVPRTFPGPNSLRPSTLPKEGKDSLRHAGIPNTNPDSHIVEDLKREAQRM